MGAFFVVSCAGLLAVEEKFFIFLDEFSVREYEFGFNILAFMTFIDLSVPNVPFTRVFIYDNVGSVFFGDTNHFFCCYHVLVGTLARTGGKTRQGAQC